MTLADIRGWVKAAAARIFSSKKLLIAAALAGVALMIASAAYRKHLQSPQPEQPKVEQPVEKPKVVKKRPPKAVKRRHVQQPSQPSWRRACDANGMCWWYWG